MKKINDSSEQAQLFWKWFNENNECYLSIEKLNESTRELYLEELQEKLHNFCEGLFFLLGEHDSEGKTELIITACADQTYFKDVLFLTSQAPVFDHWRVIAFKPAITPFPLHLDGIEFDPYNLSFIPLDNPEYPEAVGIEVIHTKYDPKSEDVFITGIHMLLEDILGEQEVAQSIDYLVVSRQIPQGAEEMIYPLMEIAEYIVEKKSEFRSGE